MGHIESLIDAKQLCNETNQCVQYQTLLEQEYVRVDKYTADSIQTALIWGALITVFGITVAMTAFYQKLRDFWAIILPKVIYVSPIVVGLVGGLIGGFAISFSACFKKSCSSLESSATVIVPILLLFVSIPFSVFLYRRRVSIASAIKKKHMRPWLITGASISLLILAAVALSVYRDMDYAEDRKEYLRTIEP